MAELKGSAGVSNYTKTFTSFSGADIIVAMGNKIIGEVQSIEYRKDIKNKEVVGEVVCTLFDREPFDASTVSSITMAYLNEYGQSFYRCFDDVTFLYEYGGATIDDITSEIKYTFRAKDTYGLEGDTVSALRKLYNLTSIGISQLITDHPYVLRTGKGVYKTTK